MMAGKPWTEEMKAAAKAKREAAKKTAPAPAPRSRSRAAAKDPVVVAVETIGGVLTVPLTALGQANESFLADALTLEMSTPALAEAVGEVAKVNPALGEFFQRGAPMTPYLLLGSVLFSIGTQFAVNHGVNLGPLSGSTVPRGALIAEKRNQLAEMARQQEEQERAYAQFAEEETMRTSQQLVEQAEAEEKAEQVQQQTLQPVI